MPVEGVGLVVVLRVGLVAVEIDLQVDTELLLVQLRRRIPVELELRHMVATVVLYGTNEHLTRTFTFVNHLVDTAVGRGDDGFTFLHLHISRAFATGVIFVLRIIGTALGIRLGYRYCSTLGDTILCDVVDVDVTRLVHIVVITLAIGIDGHYKVNHILPGGHHRVVVLLLQVVIRLQR